MQKKYCFILIGAVLGAVVGFIYWKFWGCQNGCAIKSNWYTMVPYAALMGGLLGNLISDLSAKKPKQEE